MTPEPTPHELASDLHPTEPDLLDVALRALAEPVRRPPRPRARDLFEERVPRTVLVLDTETTTDATQRLRFLVYRYYRVQSRAGNVRLSCVEEGIVYDDDLATRAPGDLALLREFAASRRAPVDPSSGISDRIKLTTRYEFVSGSTVDGKRRRGRFFEAVFKGRAWLVCFNLPFDISRLAVCATPAKGDMLGGHSLILGERLDPRTGKNVEDKYVPRIVIKPLDPKRALKRFSSKREPDDSDQVETISLEGGETGRRSFRGHFIDLRQLAFALTDRGHTLESACDAFDVPYIKREVEHGAPLTPDYVEYCREDVAATTELFEALMTEHLRHPIELQATKAFSAASIGKAHLRSLGLKSPLEQTPDFDRSILGYSMTAYHGGRTEARIRDVPLPVRHLDFLSMYPTVCGNTRTWPLVTAREISTRDSTDKVRRMLARVTLDDCLDRKLWEALTCLVQLAPENDVLPTRARYTRRRRRAPTAADESIPRPCLGIGVNPLDTSGQPVWFTLADAIASKLITGRAPKVLRAISFQPSGGKQGLVPLKLRGEIAYDPQDDLYTTLVEERQRIKQSERAGTPEGKRTGTFLKTLVLSVSYGIYAEMIQRELPKGQEQAVRVYGLDDDAFETSVPRPERLGEYAFPPIAATITGGARLMLAILETLVTQAGGIWAYTDTDSMLIVSTEHGGLIACPGGHERTVEGDEAIRALSWHQVNEIRARFRSLNPYDTKLIRDILKLEDTNFDERGKPRELFILAFSAKRYTLYTRDEAREPIIVKASEHGLGHLLNPTDPDSTDRDWITELWRIIVRRRLGLTVELPPWLSAPAITHIGASSTATLQIFEALNAHKPYGDQVKPFNFLLSAQVSRLGHPAGTRPEKFHLVQPYTRDPKGWLRTPWRDLHGSGTWTITTRGSTSAEDRVVRVKTIGDILDEHTQHPELKSLDPDAEACRPGTRGLLGRRPVITSRHRIAYIGKESNRLDDLEAGVIHDEAEILATYTDPKLERERWNAMVVPRLRTIGTRQLVALTALSERGIRDILAERAYPHATTRAKLKRALDVTA